MDNYKKPINNPIMTLFSKRFNYKKRTRIIGLSAVLILAIGGAIVWINSGKKKPADAPAVCVMPAGVQNVEIYGEYVGRIRAQQFVEVRARVEGFLENMLFEEGTHVEKGQVLFVIDPRVYKARAEKARAQLHKDEAQFRDCSQPFGWTCNRLHGCIYHQFIKRRDSERHHSDGQ